MASLFRRRPLRRREYPEPALELVQALFAFGSNGAGQLGLKHERDLSIPERVQTLKYGSVRYIVGSGNHTLLVEDISILGLQVKLLGQDQPAEIRQLASPFHSSAGSRRNHLQINSSEACAATWNAFAQARWIDPDEREKGMIIETFGSSEKGQLGRPVQLGPKPCMDNQNGIAFVTEIVCLAGGVQHFIAVLKTGHIVGWGNGRKGQLGEPAEAIVAQPRLQKLDFDVVHAVCGREFSLLLGEPGQGQFAILGSDKFGIKTDAPKDLKSWKTAGASWSTISILFEDGSVVSWGRNDHGQRAPKDLPLIEKMAVGSEHTVALSKDGEVLVWGWGEHGNCGIDVDEQKDVKDGWKVIPRPEDAPEDKRIIGVGAGCATSWFWYEELVD